MDIIKQIEREHMRMDIPAFKPGDAVKVYLRIVEGEKERIQMFQGTVIRRQRAESMVCNVHKTNDYLMTPNTAFAYCSLQDYRATNGETSAAMIFAEESPMAALQILESLLGISAEDIMK